MLIYSILFLAFYVVLTEILLLRRIEKLEEFIRFLKAGNQAKDFKDK